MYFVCGMNKVFFYIFISELASHTQNLRVNKHASIMFLRPETETRELFAREPITYKRKVTGIASGDAIFEQQLLSIVNAN